MKKFYETPAVEFAGFNAEDVITTSVLDTYNDAAAAADFADKVVKQGVADAAVSYGNSTYSW